MENFIVQVRPYVELLYFLSTILLAVVAIYGARQIGLMKADMKARSERAAKEKAIDASSRYLTSYVPLDGRHWADCQREKVPYSYKGPVGDFSPGSIPADQKAAALRRYTVVTWLPAMNELESIAASFTAGVADEQLGFKIIGRSFCATVAHHYDLISNSRHDKRESHFNDIVELYRIWSTRLSKGELEAARKELEAKLSTLPDHSIAPIGPDLK